MPQAPRSPYFCTATRLDRHCATSCFFSKCTLSISASASASVSSAARVSRTCASCCVVCSCSACCRLFKFSCSTEVGGAGVHISVQAGALPKLGGILQFADHALCLRERILQPALRQLLGATSSSSMTQDVQHSCSPYRTYTRIRSSFRQNTHPCTSMRPWKGTQLHRLY